MFEQIQSYLDFILNPYIFPFYCVTIWIGASFTLSRKSGWNRLAEQFAASGPFDGRCFRFQSARLNKVNFSNSLKMGVNETGLYLVPSILFRLFQQPLLIPWVELRAEPFEKFLFKGHRLIFKSNPDISLEISNRTFERMKDYLEAQAGFQQDY